MVLATLAVVAILYMREFRSEVLHILKEDVTPLPWGHGGGCRLL